MWMNRRPRRERAVRVLRSLTLCAALLLAALTAPAILPRAQAQSEKQSANLIALQSDPKKAKEAFRQGMKAEKQQDWSTAYSDYTNAVNWAPDDRQYQLRREIARSELVETKIDAAERDSVSGRFEEAAKELVSARTLDPTNSIINERLDQLASIARPPGASPVVTRDIRGEIRLDYLPAKQQFDYRGDTHGAYEELARRFGVEVAFDQDLVSRNLRFQIGEPMDFPTAARLLGDMTHTFWRPLTRKLFFVAEDTPQKRKDYDSSVARTVLLPASETPDQMTEVLRTVREITGITRSDLDIRSHTLTLRASPQAMAVAAQLLDSLEEPRGEMILEMEVLEVDRTLSQQLGITPPQTANAFTLSQAQLQEAETGNEGLLNLIEQVFGGSTLPPVIAFGGGISTYFATLPGASANFAQMLSLIRQGRRILLRAQDGEPASLFIGDRVPVSLANLSASLEQGTLPGSTTPGTGIVNPIANYPAGNTPSFVTTAVLRTETGEAFNDLIVANSADNDISVLLGNGDGTFANQVTYPAGTDPVAIATGEFDTAANSFVDLAVVNKGSNTISILLGNGDGTFPATPSSTLTTGATPVAIVAANFHDLTSGALDLAVANQADNTISIFTGNVNGNGTFTAPTTSIPLVPGYMPTALATAQFTNSTHNDLVITETPTTATGNNGIVLVFLGQGNGTFIRTTQSPYLVGNTPAYVTTGDFNSDGILDLVVANSGAPSTASNGTAVSGNSVSILLGIANSSDTTVGTGVFSNPTNYDAGNGPASIAVADYNLDGAADMVIADKTDNAVTILLNAGNNQFTTLPELPTGDGPVSLVSADFNGDGRPDAATADSTAAEVTVILNSISLFGSPLLGNTLPYPGVQYLDIGLKVKATPRIHPNNDVSLQLSFELSSVTGESFNSIPVISTENVDQTVRVKENETAVLAGFFQTQLSNSLNGNPGLGEIPGIGFLDSDQTAQRQDTDLIILVTPRMVRLAPRENQVIYAGQGALEGGGAAEAPAGFAPVVTPPGQQPGLPPQPGQPQFNPPQGQPPEEQQPPEERELPPGRPEQ